MTVPRTKKDPPLVIMEKSKTRGGRTTLDFWVDFDDDLQLDISPAGWLDHVSTALLMHHYHAIKSGKKASGATQRLLQAGTKQARLARAGKRPPYRGDTEYNRNNFPDNITRKRMRVRTKPKKIGRGGRVGLSASMTIRPGHPFHTQWLIEEDANGVEYFFVTGAADKVIADAAEEYFDLAVQAKAPKYTDAEFTAEDEAT